MAYQTNRGSNATNQVSSNVTNRTNNLAAGARPQVEPIYSTGLFRPDPNKSKALAGIQVRETVTIPAGSFINVYEVEADKKKSDKSPDFRLMIKPGKLKQQA